MQFPMMRRPPPTVLSRRILSLTAVAFAMVAAVLFVGGVLAGGIAIVIVLLAAFFFAFSLVDPWAGEGTILLNEEGIAIRKRMNEVRLPWVDIESVTVSPFHGSTIIRPLLALLVGKEADRSYVRVKLRRSLKVKLLPGASGTRAFGLPSGFLKDIGLYVDDPHEVEAAADQYLERGG